ncbi:MAG: arylesterase [Parasulfuritortus sp.]|nr:arylesterase [Parasulfuritortus sp.]
MRRILLFLLLFVSVPLHAATLMVLGDSLSAGYGLEPGQGWVDLLAQRLQQDRPAYSVVNASISGETSAGGLARLDASLNQARPTLLLLELGANDGLRGLSLKALRQNLDQIVTRAQKHGARVVLIGMRLPPNYGKQYTEAFHQTYVDLAARRHLPLVPFLLEGVALDPGLMQADQMHPTAKAQPALLDTVWHTLAPLLVSK